MSKELCLAKIGSILNSPSVCRCGRPYRYRVVNEGSGVSVVSCGFCLRGVVKSALVGGDHVKVYGKGKMERCVVSPGCSYWSGGRCLVHSCVKK